MLNSWRNRHPNESNKYVKARNVITLDSALTQLEAIQQEAITNGYISYSDLERASKLYEAYQTLGGNVVGTRIMSELRAIPNSPPKNK